ncbi:MAG: NUDIX domain-containing protein [Bacteroidia bacterium]|jgi:8-oxo-dGTP pyrophosphatase MutT (NUDIX family)
MYKVFVNNKPIIITSNEVDVHTITPHLVLTSFVEADLRSAIDELQYKSNYKAVYIVGNNIKQLWKDFTKHFTIIEAAGGLVKNAEGKYLFIKRNGYWDMPKGKIEKNEKIRDAATREVEEETGISNLTIQSEIANSYHVFISHGKFYIKRTYWFEMTYQGTEPLVPQLSEGIVQAEWITYDNILYSVLPNAYSNINHIVSIFFKL